MNKLLRLYSIITKRNFIKSFVVFKMTLLGKTAKYPSEVVNFEADFANVIGTKFGLSFSNATTGFEALIFSLQLKPGDKVIVSKLTFYSIVLCLLHYGLEVEFLEYDDELAPIIDDDKILDDCKLIVVSHLFGFPQSMQRLLHKQKQHGFKIIEDCSHAHGALVDGKCVGSFGDASIFSLQGDKPVSAGEGGIICTDSEKLYGAMRLYSHMGRDNSKISGPRISKLFGVGKKARMHPLGAGLAQVDLRYLATRNSLFRKNFLKVSTKLSGCRKIRVISPIVNGELGGGYFGIPVWLATEVNVEEINKGDKFLISLPYPDYRKNLCFGSAKDYLETLTCHHEEFDEVVMLYREASLAADVSFRLYFINFDFIINLNKSRLKQLDRFTAMLQ